MSSPAAQRYGAGSHVGTALDPAAGPPVSEMTWLNSLADVDEVFRSRDFEQGGGGRRDSAPFAGGGLLSLSGEDHFQRRRILSVLFRRSQLLHYEHEIFAPAFAVALQQCERGPDGMVRAELQKLIRGALCRVSAAMVGIDGVDRPEVVEHYLACMDKMAIGVNLEWVTRDHRRVTDEILPFKAQFAREFYVPSLARRHELVDAFKKGRVDRGALPLDLLTLILLHRDHFERWDDDAALRETILVNGAPASITAGVSHVVRELTDWIAAHPDDAPLVLDRDFVRRATLESIRLHPASPFLIRRALRDTTLASGRAFAAGEYVVLDVLNASRDPAVYAPEPDRYNPHRVPTIRLRPMGLTFGGGPHTCIGMSMTIGETGAVDEDGPQGLMIFALRQLYEHGVEIDPARPPRWNDVNVRNEYAEFPVRFRNA